MQPLDDRALGHVAGYFQALSEPLRLKILDALRSEPHTVNELTALLACSQANVSKHLGLLARLGFVARHAQGTSAWYRIADPAVYELCDLVCGQLSRRLQEQSQLIAPLGAAGRRPRASARATPARGTPARATSARTRR